MATSGLFHIQFYKDVVALKKTEAVRLGDLETRALSESVLAVARYEIKPLLNTNTINIHQHISFIYISRTLLDIPG